MRVERAGLQTVEPGGGDPAALQRRRQGGLVEQAGEGAVLTSTWFALPWVRKRSPSSPR